MTRTFFAFFCASTAVVFSLLVLAIIFEGRGQVLDVIAHVVVFVAPIVYLSTTILGGIVYAALKAFGWVSYTSAIVGSVFVAEVPLIILQLMQPPRSSPLFGAMGYVTFAILGAGAGAIFFFVWSKRASQPIR